MLEQGSSATANSWKYLGVCRRKSYRRYELTKAVLDRIASVDKSLHSYALVLNDLALQQAKIAEQEIANGDIKGPLHGVPIAVKDNVFTKGIVTTNGMAIRRDVKPDYDATVVVKLREAGAILLGQAASHRGSFRRTSSDIAGAGQSLEREALGWRVIERLRRRHRGRPLLCVVGYGYRRLHSVSLRRQWRNGHEANLWTGLALWRVRQLANARSRRTDGPQRRRSGCDAGRHGRPRRKRSDNRISRCAGLPGNYATGRTWPSHRRRSRLQHRRRRSGHRLAARCGDRRSCASKAPKSSRCLVPSPDQTIKDWLPYSAVEMGVAHEATYPSRKSEYGPVLSGFIELGLQQTAADYHKILKRRNDYQGPPHGHLPRHRSARYSDAKCRRTNRCENGDAWAKIQTICCG